VSLPEEGIRPCPSTETWSKWWMKRPGRKFSSAQLRTVREASASASV